VWIPFSKGRGWDCSQCRSDKELRRKRGNCGGSFQQGLPQAQKDELGLFMPAYRIAPNSGEAYSDLKIRSCPIADMNRVASLITNYNRIKTGLIKMDDIYPAPTCAIIESLEIIEYNHNQMIARQHEQSMKEASHG